MNGTVGISPSHVFIDTNNAAYITVQDMNLVQVWYNGDTNASRIISGNLNSPRSTFVTNNGDIYVDNGRNDRVDKWSVNTTNGVRVLNVSDSCSGLFIDINNIIYCAMSDEHMIISAPLGMNSNMSTSTVIAGTGSFSSNSDELHWPCGLFVDTNLTLYVADSGNNRIQKFLHGQLNGTTAVGNAAPGTVSLNRPSDVTMDGDGYLFIVERNGHRVIGSGPNGYQCIIGCSGSGGLSNQLYYPRSLSFDSFGNIYVADTDNSRIQKFLLINNSCGKINLIFMTKMIQF